MPLNKKTMKRHITLFIALCAMFLASCTHNNGDIGPLFGQWKVTAMEGDGVTLPPYDGNMYWSFQSHTIEMKVVSDDHAVWQTFGNWSKTDNELMLDFPDADRQPPEMSHLLSSSRLRIWQLDKGKAVFIYDLPDGGSITYTLKKW